MGDMPETWPSDRPTGKTPGEVGPTLVFEPKPSECDLPQTNLFVGSPNKFVLTIAAHDSLIESDEGT